MCDQPEENGGFDEDVSPPELLLASLASCAGYNVTEYLNTRQLPTAGLRIRVTSEKAKTPSRLSSFEIEAHLPTTVDDGGREGVIRAIHSCVIHNTLLNPPNIEVDVIAPGDGELTGTELSHLTRIERISVATARRVAYASPGGNAIS